MASTALHEQNDMTWDPMVYRNPRVIANPNPNPKKKQKRYHEEAVRNDGRHSINFGSSLDGGFSINRPCTSRNAAASYGRYVTFKVSTYTKSELVKLRQRLLSDLGHVRHLRGQIEASEIHGNTKSKVKSEKASGNPRYVAPFGSDAVTVEALMKECSFIVAKLMKHRSGHIFSAPVDAVALGLHDYHMIVKRPMDLGTVKTNLSKRLYSTPVEFAADVRLTFSNSMLYNPKHDPVYAMAEQLLSRFEEQFRPIQVKMDTYTNIRREDFCEKKDSNGNRVVSSMSKGKKANPKSSPVEQVFRKIESAVKEQKMGKGGTVKKPKPKAKDPSKREMSMEEKQKLGTGLQGLPQEKLPQLVQIIRKRSEHVAQDGDEIVLDIEELDTETLWELDRFVTNWKKSISKMKRQALLMNNSSDARSAPPPSQHDVVDALVGEKNDGTPEATLLPVDIETDEGADGRGGGDHDHELVRMGRGNVGSSNSSSGGGSSSSGGSSSGDQSDGDDAHS